MQRKLASKFCPSLRPYRAGLLTGRYVLPSSLGSRATLGNNRVLGRFQPNKSSNGQPLRKPSPLSLTFSAAVSAAFRKAARTLRPALGQRGPISNFSIRGGNSVGLWLDNRLPTQSISRGRELGSPECPSRQDGYPRGLGTESW